MSNSPNSISLLQWAKIHLRVAALEQSGTRLVHRFDFPDDSTVICDVYFSDDDSNPLSAVSDSDRLVIYRGWMEVGKDIMTRALQLADLPSDFSWNPRIRFSLHVGYGMGSSIVHESTERFRWPKDV